MITLSSISHAEECSIETFGYQEENGLLKQTTFIKKYHYKIFKTFEEAKKYGEVLFNPETKEYLVFDELPNDVFICVNMESK